MCVCVCVLWGRKEPLLDRKLHGSVMSHAHQPLQNHLSGHLREQVMLWSAEEILEGHQRVDTPAYARTAHKGLL